jgi:hypothetical protein
MGLETDRDNALRDATHAATGIEIDPPNSAPAECKWEMRQFALPRSLATLSRMLILAPLRTPRGSTALWDGGRCERSGDFTLTVAAALLGMHFILSEWRLSSE